MYNKNSCYKVVAHEFHANISLTNCSLCLTVKEEKNSLLFSKRNQSIIPIIKALSLLWYCKKKMFIDIQKIFSAYIEKKEF